MFCLTLQEVNLYQYKVYWIIRAKLLEKRCHAALSSRTSKEIQPSKLWALHLCRWIYNGLLMQTLICITSVLTIHCRTPCS